MNVNLRKIAERIAFNMQSKSEVIAAMFPPTLPISIRRF